MRLRRKRWFLLLENHLHDHSAMYESFLQTSLPEDVRDLFERLQQASENHLRAFRNNLRRYN